MWNRIELTRNLVNLRTYLIIGESRKILDFMFFYHELLLVPIKVPLNVFEFFNIFLEILDFETSVHARVL